MADTDQSINILRYNQATQGLEGFGGGSPQWTSLQLIADGTKPAGSDTQIQYNNGGVFGADANLTWDAVSHTLSIVDNIVATGDITAVGGSIHTYNIVADGAISASSTISTTGDVVGSTSVQTPLLISQTGNLKISPGTNGTLGVLILKADRTTVVVDIDTLNGRMGINKSNPTVALDIVGAIKSTTDITTNTKLNTDEVRGRTGALLVRPFVDSATGINFTNVAGTTVVAVDTSTPALDLNSNNIINVANPVNPQDAATKNYVDTVVPIPVLSGASAGGAANEELTVSGLLTTSIIYAVSPVTGGANNVAITGYTNDTNGSLNVAWTANPGVGASVLVLFKP